VEKTGKILVVDDNEDVLLSLNMLLKPHVEAVRVISNPERIVEFMDSFQPDVIMLDMNFRRDAISGEEGYEWLGKILEHDANSAVLFITAYVNTEKAVRAIKAGAIDFIPKPWDKEKLLDTVRSAVRLSRNRHSAVSGTCSSDYNEDKNDECIISQPSRTRKSKDNKRELIGESPVMLQLKQQIELVAATDANVLITGENGSGKDVVANALHQLSKRKDNPFGCIDLGTIPENLFESELFGYEKGAFTDAKAAKEGRIESADGGTVFLDEIGNLSLQMQQKLLTVIEKREVSRIGSNKTKKVDVRLISATNANLPAKVAEGTFRQDLLYRINTIELHLPPLRERGTDIILLAEHFLRIFAEKYNRDDVLLSSESRQKLLQHSWPGNVRELQHCMERTIVLSSHDTLTASDIQISVQQEPVSAPSSSTTAPSTILNLEELERQAIKQAIAQSDGNLTIAAELLGITRYALYRKISKLGI